MKNATEMLQYAYPIVKVLAWMLIFTWFMRNPGGFISALTGGGSQVIALLVLILGCAMLVVSKKYGIDTTIAGGVIGAATNMLTGNPQMHATRTDVAVRPGAPGESESAVATLATTTQDH